MTGVYSYSLVTTCRNEMGSLPRWLDDLSAQTRQPDEIVVVDSLSDDGTREALAAWAARDPRVKVIEQQCNAARGRNMAIEAATHEHIVSTDFGVRLTPTWFEEVVRPFETAPSLDVVCGSYRIDLETVRTAAARAESYVEGGGEPVLGAGFVPGNRSMAYTKRTWDECGGLPEDLTFYADDSVFGRQLVSGRYSVGYAPKAITLWGRPARLREFWKEQWKYGKGDGEASIKTPCAFRWYDRGRIPRWLVPPLTALRRLQQQFRLRAFMRALAKGDILGASHIPLLLLGNGWYFALGYLEGDIRGRTECLSCRSRTRRFKYSSEAASD